MANSRLIDIHTLALALKNFDARNELIKQLDLVQQGDRKIFYKRVLAFWLGSSTTIEKIANDPLFEESKRSIIYIGYYCILALDKLISLLEPSIPRKILCRARRRILTCYNENYSLLREDTKKLGLLFESIIKDMEGVHAIVESAKQQCLGELSRLLLPPSFGIASPAKEVGLISIDNLNISVLTNRIITANLFEGAVFYKDSLSGAQSKNHFIYKMLLPANDGILLDGLYVKKRESSSRTVVLALIGHFQSEHHYIASSIIPLQQLFDTDIVFINHRNYSYRAARFASSIDELANDVIDFAHYFKQKNKNIVLYGMCGGAAHIIMAAANLTKNNIHFKLIVDRFSSKYINFIDFKTSTRRRDLLLKSKPSPNIIDSIIISDKAIWLIIPLYLFLLFFIKLLFYATKVDIDFSKIIHSIPEQDLLVLQVKSEIQTEKNEPLFTDFYVHPENDLRAALKDRRYKNKLILKSLRSHSFNITRVSDDFKQIQKIFLKLWKYFNYCIELIDNEKLTLNIKPSYLNDDDVTDLHTHRLYQLTTRNKLPLGQFISGFFKQPTKTCNDSLATLKAYPYADILISLCFSQGTDTTIREGASQIARGLFLFLKELKENEPFVSYMANRLSATGLGDINEPVRELLNSPLFQLLSEIPLKESLVLGRW